MTRRRNTVHDLAALRLHPDGSRVHVIDRQSKYIAKDPRGNLIAVDAGGSGTVKKRRRVQDPNDEEQETIDIDGVVSASEQHDPHSDDTSKHKGKGKRKVKAVKDPRAKKRQTFYEDFSFVDRTKPWDWKAEGPSAIPSSDLLKCIHYFATEFYTDRGQLLDATRDARREKKQRKLEKQRRQRESENRASETENSTSDEESVEIDNRSGTGESSSVAAKGGKGKERLHGQRVRDMYKIFDGTALMALGMIFQEHVVKLLQSDVAPDWEQSMLEAGDDETLQEFEDGRLILGKRKPMDGIERGGVEDLTIHVESDDGDSDEFSDFVA